MERRGLRLVVNNCRHVKPARRVVPEEACPTTMLMQTIIDGVKADYDEIAGRTKEERRAKR